MVAQQVVGAILQHPEHERPVGQDDGRQAVRGAGFGQVGGLAQLVARAERAQVLVLDRHAPLAPGDVEVVPLEVEARLARQLGARIAPVPDRRPADVEQVIIGDAVAVGLDLRAVGRDDAVVAREHRQRVARVEPLERGRQPPIRSGGDRPEIFPLSGLFGERRPGPLDPPGVPRHLRPQRLAHPRHLRTDLQHVQGHR
jgi:hypothetical protein